MKIFVAGITGQIGGAVARRLLAHGVQIRALVRDTDKAKKTWDKQGVELRSGDLTSADALTAALKGVEAGFLMQPTPFGVTREFPEAKALTDAIVEALDQEPPPRAVVLSSIGSEQHKGLGNITQTHLLEQALERFSFPLAIVRPGSLLENYLPSIERAEATGVLASFLQPVDRGFPMTAALDVGAVVARLLVQGWSGRKIVEVGSYFTPVQIADAMARVLGKPIEARAIPVSGWTSTLEHMGLTDEKAANWAEMMEGFNSGWINFGRPGTESVPGQTSPDAVFATAIGRKRQSQAG